MIFARMIFAYASVKYVSRICILSLGEPCLWCVMFHHWSEFFSARQVLHYIGLMDIFWPSWTSLVVSFESITGEVFLCLNFLSNYPTRGSTHGSWILQKKILHYKNFCLAKLNLTCGVLCFITGRSSSLLEYSIVRSPSMVQCTSKMY